VHDTQMHHLFSYERFITHTIEDLDAQQLYQFKGYLQDCVFTVE
jgi:hypothetical protein